MLNSSKIKKFTWKDCFILQTIKINIVSSDSDIKKIEKAQWRLNVKALRIISIDKQAFNLKALIVDINVK